jgi:hypothetical protein
MRRVGVAVRTRSLLAAMVGAVAITGASAGAAFAGEVTGSGKPTAGPEHAQSICVFSGLNDDPDSTDPMDPGGVAQSYGFSVVSQGLKDVEGIPSPGEACNGHTGFFAGGGGE